MAYSRSYWFLSTTHKNLCTYVFSHPRPGKQTIKPTPNLVNSLVATVVMCHSQNSLPICLGHHYPHTLLSQISLYYMYHPLRFDSARSLHSSKDPSLFCLSASALLSSASPPYPSGKLIYKFSLLHSEPTGPSPLLDLGMSRPGVDNVIRWRMSR